ncbi:MAG: tRNA dihydrouridine synthase DusB [Firmicutes bacterium]|nr:tRNA dihydrouridine synthase DusB [Bacillota bacterium]
MSFFIGNVEIPGKIIVAPMAGISNKTFRMICKEFGASLVVGEMVSDKAIMFGNEKTLELLEMDEKERPISQQIFGSDLDSFVEAAKRVYDIMHPDIIDINMGCPVPKVAIKNQAGSALLKNPDKIYEIVSNVVKAIPVPVTVKIRAGWDEKSINCEEVAKICEKAGASAITLHARTRAQGYSGKADWALIKKVVQAVKIPVIGNGDVISCYDAKKMLDETGCAAVMIGRGLLGNPWLVKECVEYLENGKAPCKISFQEKIEMMKRHLLDLVEEKGEQSAVLEIRTHFLYYLKGMPGNAEIKNVICKAKTKEEIINILDKYWEVIKDENTM